MGKDTKDQLLSAATRLFAEKGFYGASIANIADELGLTKQALLHHYGSKEALYAAVLARLSEHLARRIAASASTPALATGDCAEEARPDGARRLEAALIGLLPRDGRDRDALRLLMRELLDNPARAAKARRWPLKSFLDTLVALTREVPGLEPMSEVAALRLLYQLIGAGQYFTISEASLKGMYGAALHREMRDGFVDSHRALIRAALAAARDDASR